MADSRPEPEVVKTEEEWRAILTPEQYRVLREEGTERAGTGEYDKHFKKGVYYCVGCNAVLYDSETKVRPTNHVTGERKKGKGRNMMASFNFPPPSSYFASHITYHTPRRTH